MYALRLAFVADKEVADEHAQWRSSEQKSRLGAAQYSVEEGAGAAISAWVGEECNRVFGHDLRAGLAGGARAKELDAWEHFEVRKPLKVGGISEVVSNIERAPSWDVADGDKCVKARQGARASRCPDLIVGSVEKWKIWGLDIRNLSLRAGAFGRNVFLRATAEWDSPNANRIWR